MTLNFVTCPLCLTESETIFCYGTNPDRPYHRCTCCELIFVPRAYQLNEQEEKAIYDQHENNPMDAGYRKFLGKLATPVLQRLEDKQTGLDFGCGPGPTLHLLMSEAGHKCLNFDPIYHNVPALLDKEYNYLLSTEVFEHLRSPREVIANLFSMIKPGGLLGVMTKLVPNDKPFLDWHYIKDPTHICFYHPKTMEYIAREFGAQLEILGPDVMIFNKPCA